MNTHTLIFEYMDCDRSTQILLSITPLCDVRDKHSFLQIAAKRSTSVASAQLPDGTCGSNNSYLNHQISLDQPHTSASPIPEQTNPHESDTGDADGSQLAIYQSMFPSFPSHTSTAEAAESDQSFVRQGRISTLQAVGHLQNAKKAPTDGRCMPSRLSTGTSLGLVKGVGICHHPHIPLLQQRWNATSSRSHDSIVLGTAAMSSGKCHGLSFPSVSIRSHISAATAGEEAALVHPGSTPQTHPYSSPHISQPKSKSLPSSLLPVDSFGGLCQAVSPSSGSPERGALPESCTLVSSFSPAVQPQSPRFATPLAPWDQAPLYNTAEQVFQLLDANISASYLNLSSSLHSKSLNSAKLWACNLMGSLHRQAAPGRRLHGMPLEDELVCSWVACD
jgi:hypothetical protein